MAKLYTSDLHIGHKRICEFTDRKLVTNKEDHNAWLIQLWNKQVNKGDLVYILGDISFLKYWEDTAFYLSKMNGQKFVVKGNHDRSEDLDKLKENGFIVGWDNYKTTKIGDKTVVLFHFAIASWDRQHYGSLHLHGHSHGAFQGEGKSLDVGIDSSYNLYGEHKLFTEDMILEFMQNRPIYIADKHRSNKAD